METESDIDLLGFLKPLHIVADYDDYLQEVCDKLMQQIQIAQRRQRVESTKQEMIHRNIYSEYPNDPQTIAKIAITDDKHEEVPPIVALLRETSFRTAQHIKEIANSPNQYVHETEFVPLKDEGGEDSSDDKSVDSLTTDTTPGATLSATTPPVRFPKKKQLWSSETLLSIIAKFSPEKRPQTGNNDRRQNREMILSPGDNLSTMSSASSLGPLHLVNDEVFWDLRFAQNVMLRESRLFHFGSSWWSLLFGVNNANPSFFYFFITPAEKLKHTCQVGVEFCVHPHNTYPKDTKPPHVYRRASSRNYIFPPDVNISRGFEKFIGEEIKPFISPMGKLRLSVRISSGVGPNGELVGSRTIEG